MNDKGMFTQWSELHAHSEYSNLRMLDSTNKIKKLIYKAVELGLKGLAITDHESVSGWVKAIQIQKELNNKGIDFKVMLGNEIYLVDSLEDVKEGYTSGKTKFYHFILIAKDSIGAEQIRRLSSKAWSHSFYTGKVERVPTIKKELETIIGDDKGHIIASTACLGGELADCILRNDANACMEFIDWCQEIFLEENFFLEMQPSDDPFQIKVNKVIISINKQINVPYIVTTDAHYLTADQAKIHEAYLNSREDESREVLDFYKTCYLMTGEEIHAWMDEYIGVDNVNKALQNTLKIQNMIEFIDMEHSTIVPDADIPTFRLRHLFKEYYESYEYFKKYAYSENKYDRYLLKKIEDGYEEKIIPKHLSFEDTKIYIERIEIELKEMWLVTEKLGSSISSYYIATLELIDIMWNEGDSLVGCARGSVTGMLTMYLIGITQVNPIPYDLKHWRHISHTKVELSDVDVDSAANRRGKIIEGVKKRKGTDKVLNCCTFKTEGSKSAIQTAGRGLGLTSDETQYISSMIPVTRGATWTLNDCLNGNAEDDKKPIVEFARECNKFPGLLDTALSIEGMVCGRSIHASAVYLFNEDYNVHNAMMRAPNGVEVTQFNMKDSDYCSGLKMDLLTVEALDKIRLCMDLLLKAGRIKWQGSLKATYDKYLHPDVLDYDTKEMWDMVGKNSIIDLFQFDTLTGVQAAQKINPHNIFELATANSVMRLMVAGDGKEQPIDTYVRYKNNIDDWYDCMIKDYHLKPKEIEIMEKYLKNFYGVGATQEDVMVISMDEHVSNFDVKTSNLLRKGIAKKDKKLQQQMKTMFFEKGKEIGTSNNLLNYVWNEVVGKQLGYSFSINHTTPYSIIGLQELNLAYHYPIVYWNTACLTINAGADESLEDNKTTDYGKVATAISNMQKRGINISLPLINEAKFDFVPDEANNRIIYALKALNGIGDDVAHLLIDNQPYASMDDFTNRMLKTGLVKPSQMLQLIKAGCFTELHNSDRNITMGWFIYNFIFEPCEALGLQQFNRAVDMNIIPEHLMLNIEMVYFKKYVLKDDSLIEKYINPDKKMVKRGYHDGYYVLDSKSMEFFKKHFTEDSVVKLKGDNYVISEKKFEKEVDSYIQPLKDWFATEEALEKYNTALFNELWNKYAKGDLADWEMSSLCFYYSYHRLKDVELKRHGIVDFYSLPEEPEIYDEVPVFVQGQRKYIPKYKIVRIAGTVLDSNNNRHTVTVLTTTGVVTVKFSRGAYAEYNKRISEQIPGTEQKKVIEDGWFKRGQIIICAGYRRENIFRAHRYKDTIYTHTCNLIKEITENNTLIIQSERSNRGGGK